MQKKILILGRNGQLATDLIAKLKDNSAFKLSILDRKDADFSNTSELKSALSRSGKNDIVINCTSYNHVDKAQTDQDNAFKVNRDAVLQMAKFCKKNNSLFIHFSTNYIFNGANLLPNKEDNKEFIKPLSIYGQSKLEGENEVIKSGCQFLIFRLSTVFREGKNNFITKIIELIKSRNSLQVVKDQISNPCYSYDIAEILSQIIDKIFTGQLDKKVYNNIYHLSNKNNTSFFDLACFVLNILEEKDIKVLVKNIKPIQSSQYQTPASRPLNGTFDLSLFEKNFNIEPPTWQDSVNRMIEKHEK